MRNKDKLGEETLQALASTLQWLYVSSTHCAQKAPPRARVSQMSAREHVVMAWIARGRAHRTAPSRALISSVTTREYCELIVHSFSPRGTAATCEQSPYRPLQVSQIAKLTLSHRFALRTESRHGLDKTLATVALAWKLPASSTATAADVLAPIRPELQVGSRVALARQLHHQHLGDDDAPAWRHRGRHVHAAVRAQHRATLP